MKLFLYYIFKIYIKTGLFFYSKKIKVSGKENIPKRGAILFTANHPNGLIDPLLIATQINRKVHFLVQAAVFKSKITAFLFNLLGMMPIYRIRDGIKQLSKNEVIFNKCQQLLKNNKTLLIFPEGSHNKKRTIRPLSKGFTRILFGTINNYPETKVYIVPIGITYQNSSSYPSKTAINIGKPILANKYYNKTEINKSVNEIKTIVANQLKNLTVHIKDDEDCNTTLEKLNNINVDYTKVREVNALIKQNKFFNKKKEKQVNYKNPVFYLLLLNSIIPYSIWKIFSKKVTEIEFIDTFRFGLNAILFPLFYIIQSWIISLIFNYTIGLLYLIISFLIVLTYTKTAATPAK